MEGSIIGTIGERSVNKIGSKASAASKQILKNQKRSLAVPVPSQRTVAMELPVKFRLKIIEYLNQGGLLAVSLISKQFHKDCWREGNRKKSFSSTKLPPAHLFAETVVWEEMFSCPWCSFASCTTILLMKQQNFLVTKN